MVGTPSEEKLVLGSGYLDLFPSGGKIKSGVVAPPISPSTRGSPGNETSLARLKFAETLV